ncbi:hypothetical protein JCM6882_009511 [Rhodosporidiobolus microsporus]
MLSPTVAPPPPPSSSKPRPRAQTLMSSVPPVDRSPTSNRSYFQPTGTGSQRRTNGQPGHLRSRSQGDAMASAAAAGVGKGKRRAVFCDVVVDELELGEDGECLYPSGPAAAFLDSLGTSISLPEAGPSSPPPVRPMTPGKTPRVDYDKVRQNLHELWVTEESYLRKMASLLRDYAIPLRSFSKKRETAIIPAFEATHLFVNIEQLVPVAEAFERDLRLLVDELQRTPSGVPSNFGAIILRHVERMTPYKKWLANVTGSEAIRQNLDKTNSSFREFVERTQVLSRESAQTTGGFKEFLAEPFQRISRYRLMLDPMAFYLPPDDPNVEPLQQAAAILTDICSMQVDDATKRAAIFWSLKETIDGFPDAMVGFDREFVGCIDADEIIEVADSRPTTLRCTLFLFNDTLLIAKRPSGEKPGKSYTGLDDLDRLLTLYQTSHLSSTQASLLGSPKKLQRRALGFRGIVNLSEVVAVDLGSSPSGSSSSSSSPDFGLMFDHPPMDQSERWCGRPARKFVVASTYAPDVRRPEKEAWLTRFAETVSQGKLRAGASKAVRGKRVWEESGAMDSTEVYWAVWKRRAWESLPGRERGKLALYLGDASAPPAWGTPREGRPVVSARATFLPDARCCFEVRSNGSSTSADTIGLDRITAAVAELGFSYGLFSFPHLRPLTLAERPSRPRSNLFTAALEVFSGGNGLKRQHSMTSKTSSIATTTVPTPNLSASLSPGLGSPFSSSRHGPTSPRQHQLSQSMRMSLSKKSEPNLHASVAQRQSGFSRVEEDAYGGMLTDGNESGGDLVGSMGAAPHRNRRAAGRRSLSLPPPPQARFGATPSPERADDDLSPSRSSIADDIEIAELEVLDPSPTMDAVDEPQWPLRQDSEAPNTSPMAYRPQVGSTRRRMIGPRNMREPSEGADSSVSVSSPAHLPFAREHSPTPLRLPHSSNGSTATYQSSPGYSDVALVDENGSQPGSSKRTRPPVEMSPRPTPAKKVASLAGAAPRQPSTLQQPPLFPAGRNASGASIGPGAEKRIPSSSSIGRIHIRSRRVTSGATIRGPPSPPKAAEQPDVFSSPAATPVKGERKPVPVQDAELEDDPMDTDDLPPIQRLKNHVDYLRLRLSREVANKENGRIGSPTALSRSPHTRNVFAKTLGDPSFSSPIKTFNEPSPFATFSEPRRPTEQNIDLAVLSRWTRKLNELIEACEEALNAKPPSPEPVADDGAALEVAMLEQERDLLAADLAAIKEEAGTLVEQEQELRTALETSQAENAKMRQAYLEICNEADVLLAEFNIALEGVTLAAQAEPTATHEYVELTAQLQAAVSGRFQAEQDLRKYRREVQEELEEKARWGELLRQHGLLPV